MIGDSNLGLLVSTIYLRSKLSYTLFLIVFLLVHTIFFANRRYKYVFKRKLVILVLLAMASTGVRAQYDPLFSHYYDMETSFNPAAVGKRAVLNVTAAYALELAGFRRNPQTAYASADIPFYGMKMYQGAGIMLMNDKIGLFSHQRLQAMYAAKFKLFGGMMSVGVQAGLLSESLDTSELDLEDSNDDAFATGEGSALDMSAGLYYLRGPLYAGISATHLTAPLVHLGERNEIQVDRTYYLTGGYNIQLRNPFLSVQPSFLVRTDMVAWRADVTGRLTYKNDKKMMYLGATYSPKTSVTLLVGGSIHGILVGYSYEFYTSAINPANGSHELYVGYQQDINLVKKGKNRHQSVRIL
ncbi:MAG: PorP/SprF family type IX secretion system membrane protein [Prevotella sp.]|nr:PorP/SprF family type IX secretion system membrane protein [Prevotella sp.]